MPTCRKQTGSRKLGPLGLGVVLGGLIPLVGCNDPTERFGKTYYLDGAGNWGFGVAEVASGLRAAGYQGHVEVYLWTTSFNPAIDQVNRPMAHLRAAILTGKIQDYLRRYPDNDVNIIALSAGTGVAVWAVEALEPPFKVNNMILLGSSLSYDYDMRKALRHIKGKVIVYYSPHDSVLEGPVRWLGTIDGKVGVDSAGLAGLHPPGGGQGKIINIGWSPRFLKYGWTGAHTDCTSESFVRAELAKYIVGARNRPRARPVFQPTVPPNARWVLARCDEVP